MFVISDWAIWKNRGILKFPSEYWTQYKEEINKQTNKLDLSYALHTHHGNSRGQSSISSTHKISMVVRFKLLTFSMGTIEDSSRLAEHI